MFYQETRSELVLTEELLNGSLTMIDSKQIEGMYY